MTAENVDKAFFGHVEICSSSSVAGWVWDSENPNHREELEICYEGSVLEVLAADQFRQDLLDAKIGDGRYGFTSSLLEIPNYRSVEVRVKRTGILLNFSDSIYFSADTITASAEAMLDDATFFEVTTSTTTRSSSETSTSNEKADNSGHLQAILLSDFTLVGVSFSSKTNAAPPSVRLYVDGVYRAKSLADKLTSSSFSNDYPHNRGFLFQIPDPPPDRSVSVAELKSVGQTCSIEVDYQRRYGGNLERYEYAAGRLRIAGWVHDRARVFDPVSIDIKFHGRVLTTILANKSRADLQAAGIGMGNHSFDSIISWDVEQFSIDELEFYITGTTISVRRDKLTPFTSGSSVLHRVESSGLSKQKAQPSTFDLDLMQINKAYGHVDSITNSEVRGWAVNPDDVDEPVVIDLLVDNQLVATTKTNRYRLDLAQKFSSEGYHAFNFEMLPQYGSRSWRQVLVRIRGGSTLQHGDKPLQLQPMHVSLPTYQIRRTRLPNHAPRQGEKVELSIIILNLNGRHVLQEFFSTLREYESYSAYEVLVVDHGSDDDSEQVCIANNDLGVRFLARGRNFSFSESNNFAANQANGSILAFLNNDIFFCQPVFSSIKELFHTEKLGCVGIQLLDTPSDAHELTPPTVQTIGIHFNFQLTERAIHPIESRYHSSSAREYFSEFRVPCVTGAFLVMRAKEFLQIGGFDENYNYGYEDVDICLKVLLDLKKDVLCATRLLAFHHRGYSRKKSGKWSGSNMTRNRLRLEKKFAYRVRRDFLSNLLTNASFWLGRPLVFAFAVTEASNSTPAGDFFTAAELGESLRKKTGWKIIFLEEKKNWYDLSGVDILCVMRHDYKLSLTSNKKATLITIAWARNWFQKWAESREILDYNILAASGDEAVSYLKRKASRPVSKLNIGTNYQRFENSSLEPSLRTYDVIFTGNFWGHPREVAYFLRPEALTCSFHVFGAGWDKVSGWARHSEGLKPYGELPELYRQSKIALDDANSVTKEWGSVNSRVFDAIAAGCVVFTNGVKGALAEFGGVLPTYSSTHELHDLISKFTSDENHRLKVVKQLQSIVYNNHTYETRTNELLSIIETRIPHQRRFAIKIGAPSKSVSHEWGDLHFAESLKEDLVARGHVVRVDCMDEWYSSAGYGDDCVIVLRGLSSYKPKLYQCNIIWIISHPDLVPIAEYTDYDIVFTASEKHKRYLIDNGVAAQCLLQCTDPSRFFPVTDIDHTKENKVVFVGNTRNIFRPTVKYAIEQGVDLSVIGAGWQDFIPATYVAGDYVANGELQKLYGSAMIVLNDHWESMRQWGFISNRVFDVVACGVLCLSDDVIGLRALFGDAVISYESQADFSDVFKAAMVTARDSTMLRAASDIVRREHTFSKRVGVILEAFENWERLTETCTIANHFA